MEILIEILAELIFQVFGEVLVTLGWESVAHSIRGEKQAEPILAGIGYVVFGAILGGLSLWLLPHRVLPVARNPGMSLVISPLVTGAVMKQYGTYRRSYGRPVTSLATFWGGAIFAFSIALVRFLAL